MHGSTFHDRIQDPQDPNIWVFHFLQSFQILFQGIILLIVLLGTNPTWNQFFLFWCIRLFGIILTGIGCLCLSFVLLLPLPLLLLLNLGILTTPRTCLGFTLKFQQFIHCSDCYCKYFHVLSSRLTFHPRFHTIHEVEKSFFFLHVFDIQYHPCEILDVGLDITNVLESQQLIPCDPCLVPQTKLCLQGHLHLYLVFDLLNYSPSY